MKHRRVWLSGLVGLGLLLFGARLAEAQSPPGGGPPPQAFDACRGKQQGDPCGFQGLRGQLDGQCRKLARGVVCAPTQGPGSVQGPGSAGGQAGGMGRNGYDDSGEYPGARKVVNKLTDTGQGTCFDNRGVIQCPAEGAPFFGQDAHYQSRPPAYRDNSDGTIDDLNTGLLWQKAHHRKRVGYQDAARACRNLRLGGHQDWRLPNIKELFSIADFRGSTGRRFFIDGSVFDFALPDQSILEGDRFAATHRVNMMGQTWSGTIYTGSHWDRPGVEAAFFFNFLDGRIKQAPTRGRNGLFYRCVRGPAWGGNAFRDNGDGTVSDRASGLMWLRTDDGKTRDWGGALRYCEGLRLAGHDDWRLPNVKELQHIVDYRQSDPALDLEYLAMSDRNGWFWSSTTHGDNIRMAAYVCFGKCISVDGVDVHGAGAQRSDPKTGDPASYPPMGGQRDQVRIQNYARCVRDG